MLAKRVDELPVGEAWIFEPKWDGFRALVFRDGDEILIQSRDEKPLNRYFPELLDPLRSALPARCVLDGEIVVVVGNRLEFEVLQQRIHPAASRVSRLARETPATFIAFDILANGDEDYMARPFAQRRHLLEQVLVNARPPIHLTPATTDHQLAERWFEQFEGAGLDGVVAKPLEGVYEPDRRVMFKIKHERTADCVVAGYRVHVKDAESIGSLLLGLYNDSGELMSVGVIGAFPAAQRRELFVELQGLVTTFDDHPWAWAREAEGIRTPRNAEGSRWAVGKDLSFTPLRPERVVEVRYEHMEGIRFRHTAQFIRWRPDRDPRSCTYEQLEEPVKYDLADILSTSRA
jgi:ATP-dependent DNA ligase